MIFNITHYRVQCAYLALRYGSEVAGSVNIGERCNGASGKRFESLINIRIDEREPIYSRYIPNALAGGSRSR